MRIKFAAGDFLKFVLKLTLLKIAVFFNRPQLF